MLATRLLRNAVASASAAARPQAVSSLRTRTSTNLTGLAVHPSPLPALHQTYTETLQTLHSLPQTSVYRQAALAVTQARLEALERARSDKGDGEGAIEAFEGHLDAGLVEEVLQQARDEHELAKRMAETKAHEPLEHPPPPGQWDFFNMHEAAGEGQ